MLPDEAGRLQILEIHTNKMKENSFLAPDVNLQELAARTTNYVEAELEGVAKSAMQLSMDNLTKLVDVENMEVTMEDFLNVLQEVESGFGASVDDLQICRLDGMIDCSARHEHIKQRAMPLAQQVRQGRGSSLMT